MSHYFCLICVVLFCLSGCHTPSQVQEQPVQKSTDDNKYDSEYPDKAVAKTLDFVSKTVKKLDCLVFYESMLFAEESGVELETLSDSLINAVAIARTITNESVTGTATQIYFDGTRVALLTCAHVIDFPDTLITRYEDGSGSIETLSVKLRQQNYVKEIPDGTDIEILAKDADKDIAILGKVLDSKELNLSVLNFPVGNTRDLEWGSIVYVMGYPLGQLMVTRAIVSNPDKANKGRFLTDALYNRGISGSPVLAIRDGVPNFEWVGMATSAAAQQIYYIKPGDNAPQYINPEAVYIDELFVDKYRSINYGVTFNVSIESIVTLIRRNSSLLERKGYNPDRFFK